MKRLAPWLAIALAASAPPAGCSLVALSDDIAQGRCKTHADCAVLNTEDALAEDACLQWQCDPQTALCAYGPLDRDHDGTSPDSVVHDGRTFTCEPDRARRDCDDEDPERAPGADELCNGRDDDCDGRADEGALRGTTDRVLLLPEDDRVTQVAYARDAENETVAIGYSLERDASRRPGLHLLPPTLAADGEVAAVTVGDATPHGEQVGVAAIGGRFAYAYVDTGGGAPRLVAGVAAADRPRVEVDAALLARGLACLKDEACPGESPAKGEPVATPASPALARLGSRMLLAYLRHPDAPARPECGGLLGASGEEQPEVRANLLAIDPGPRLRELTSANEPWPAIALGTSAATSPPAIAALGRLGGEPEAPGFLVTYVDAAGRVVLDRVTERDGELAVTQRGVIVIEGDAPHASVAIEAGPALAGIQVLGIAYQRGCGADAQVLFGLYRLRLARDENGGAARLTAEAVASDVVLGGGSGARSPALAFLPRKRVWAVVFRDDAGLRARVIEADGQPHAAQEEPYLLLAEQDDRDAAVRVLLAPAVVPLGADDEDDWFGVIAHVERAAETVPLGFEVVRVGCR